MASLGAIVAQGVLAVPRAWRSRRGLVVGLAVTLVALVIALAARLLTRPVVDSQQLAYSDTLAIVFDIALLGTIALLAVGRPRRLRERLRVPVMDAWVGTGLGVTAVGIFTVAGYFLAHAPH